MRRIFFRRLAVVLLVLIFAAQRPAPAEQSVPDRFTRTEVMIPMRDGVRLQTAIFVPKNTPTPMPFLFTRGPYGIPSNENWARPGGNYEELIADGYIFVFQNLRGRFKSEGQWVMQRPPHPADDPKGIDETTDAYDTIDWLIKNITPNNGRAGMWGVSYAGWTTAMALVDPHPALKAASEQASPADMFLGDDFHHNGAFRLSYGFEYSALLESAKEANTHFKFDRYDTYEWYLALGALPHANERYFRDRIPTWNDFAGHPNRDDFWRRQAFDSFLRVTRVPNLNVAGWWDQEDFYGPQKVYSLLEAGDSRQVNHFVAGPWNHGGWWGPGARLGPIEFGSETGKYFRARIQAPWFAYWLHDKGAEKPAEAITFRTGVNEWKSYDAWPPKQGITPRRLYFHSNRRLSFEAPAEDTSDAFDSYVSDPANPVPYRPRPITPTYPGPDWPVWQVQDQRFADFRPDVLSWETEPLTEDVVITGEVVADLFASTSGTDSDWIVKLIDVYPDDYMSEEQSVKEEKRNLSGYQLMIAGEVFRGRFRDSFEKPQPIPADQVQEYKFSLYTHDHAFKKSHRIMVQVQSTWFPLIDRNPQKFVPNIFTATDADYVKVTHRIFRSRNAASGVIVPIMEQKAERGNASRSGVRGPGSGIRNPIRGAGRGLEKAGGK